MKIVPLLVTTGFAWVLLGAGPTENRLAGSYSLVGGLEKNQAKVDQVVADSVAEVSFAVRSFVKSKLQNVLRLCKKRQIEFTTSGEVALVCDQRPVAKSSFDGSPAQYQDEAGDSFRLTQTVTGNEIVQAFQSKNGTRTSRFVLRPDGNTLDVAIEVVSDRFEGPVELTLTYRRD